MSMRLLLFVLVFLLVGWPEPQLPAQQPRAPPPSKAIKALKEKWDSGDKNPAWPAARPLALLSKAAYDELPAVRAEALKLGLANVEPVRSDMPNMVAYVCKGERVAVVTFRGTDDRADWSTNLDFIASATQFGSEHRGFRNAFNSMKKDLFRQIRQANPEVVWLTGHSLGGAFAAVCAHDLLDEEDITLHGVMTFGQPMTAHRRLAEHLDHELLGRFVHFVNEGDLVPRLPPIRRYRHFGRLAFLTENGIDPKRFYHGTWDEEPQQVEVRPMSDAGFRKLTADVQTQERTAKAPRGAPPKQRYGGDLPIFRNHSMELYLERVEKFMKPATGHVSP